MASTVALFLRDETLAIARLDPADDWPSWAPAAGFLVVARTEDELSVVCPEGLVPEEVRAERGWRAYQVDGPLDFGLVGLLAGLTAALASSGIAVFAISTFDTDLLMVRGDLLAEATAALRGAGYVVREAK